MTASDRVEKRRNYLLLDRELETIKAFQRRYLNNDDWTPRGALEEQAIDSIEAYVAEIFGRAKYILGLAIDFCVLGSQVGGSTRSFRPEYTSDTLFSDYKLVESRGDTQANTLTLVVGDRAHGIRQLEEAVLETFHELSRPSYPVAYVYNTGQWQKYKDLLAMCFQLSSEGAVAAVDRLFRFGLANMAAAATYGRPVPKPRLFLHLLVDYPRSVTGENGGLTYQALAYGYFLAQFPLLALVTDKTRGSSRRQRRLGDIDGYYGLDLELSSEVKDLDITADNCLAQLGDWAEAVSDLGTVAIAFVRSIEPAALQLLPEGISVLDEGSIRWIIDQWDWPKQDLAFRGTLHFLSHIEQNPNAVQRMLRFVETIDPDHDALVYLASDES